MTTEINDGGSAFPQLDPRDPQFTLCSPGANATVKRMARIARDALK